MNIGYKINTQVSSKQFIALLQASTLGERRPIDDAQCINGMLTNSSLPITAWSRL